MHNAQFIIHNAQFIIHNAQFIIHNAQFIIHNAQFIIHNSQFIKRKDENEIDTRSTLVASSMKNYRNGRNDYGNYGNSCSTRFLSRSVSLINQYFIMFSTIFCKRKQRILGNEAP